MKATPLAIPDVMQLEPKVFGDVQGCLKQRKFAARTGHEVKDAERFA